MSGIYLADQVNAGASPAYDALLVASLALLWGAGFRWFLLRDPWRRS